METLSQEIQRDEQVSPPIPETETTETVPEQETTPDETPEETPPEETNTPGQADARELISLISQDSRVGHFIVDILAGADPKEAATKHFPADSPDIDTLVAEAEKRGYLRGRNEKIELEMKRPALWDETAGEKKPDKPEPQPSILNNMRRSVWD